jgi:acyl carrier protein
MNRSDFLNKLADILEVDVSQLTGPENLADVGNWDSLSIITFVAMVDSDFQLMVDPEKLQKAKTVDDLLALVDL